MDIRKVKKLIEMMENADISEIEIKEGDDSVRISRSGGAGSFQSGAGQDAASDVDRRPAPVASVKSGNVSASRTSRRSTRQSSFSAEQRSAPRVPVSPLPKARNAATEQREEREGTQTVHAPMVGTFYHAPDPDSAPFFQIGDRVNEGDTLCIIESMKMMNRIIAEFDGVLEEVLIENEGGVEYDQPLFILETSLP